MPSIGDRLREDIHMIIRDLELADFQISHHGVIHCSQALINAQKRLAQAIKLQAQAEG